MIIESRYNGPADSANGGWTAGLVAAALAGAGVDTRAGATVTLHRPPPLAVELRVEVDGAEVQVLDGAGELIATGRAEPLDQPAVPPVELAVAEAAAGRYPGHTAHPFPSCFVCGPKRAEGDGLRLFPGRLPDGRTACPWRVPGDVSPTMLWSALDCPGGWAVGIEARPYVLGRLAARVHAVPLPGDQCVVTGQLVELAGRKAQVRTSLYGPAGDLLANGTATWIALR